MSGDPAPAPEPEGEPDEEPSHEETVIESSIVPAPLPPAELIAEPRGRIPVRFIVSAGIAVLLLAVVGFAVMLRAERLQAALAAFERVQVEGTPEEALAAAQDLPPALRDDPQVAAQVGEFEHRVAARAYLSQLGDFQTGLQRAKTYAERIALCDQALVAQAEPLRVQAERIRASFHQRMALVTKAGEVSEALSQAAQEVVAAKLLNADPPWGRFLLARLRWRHRGAKAAESQLAGLTPEPQTGVGHLAIGLRYQATGKRQLALTCYGRGLQLDPRLADGYLLRGALRLELGNARGALQDAEKAQELDPLSTEARVLLAEVALLRGDRKAARAQVDAALALDGKDAFALGLSGYLRVTSGDPAQTKSGLAQAKRGSRLNPHAPWGILALARHALDSGKLQSASPLIGRLLRSRAHLEGYLLRARLHLSRGQTTAALQDLSLRVLRYDPKNVEGLLLSIEARVMAKQYDAALRLADRLQLVRESPTAFYWRGRIHLLRTRRDTAAAIEALTQAVALDPKHGSALAYRAQAYARRGRYVAALADLDAAAKLKVTIAMPAWERALIRGTCHQRLGEKDAALKAYRRFITTAPAGHRRIGWAQMQIRRLTR